MKINKIKNIRSWHGQQFNNSTQGIEPECAYISNTHALLFSRTFKKTNEWETLNQIMHRQKNGEPERSRQGSESLTLSLSFSLSVSTKAVDLLKANTAVDRGPSTSLVPGPYYCFHKHKQWLYFFFYSSETRGFTFLNSLQRLVLPWFYGGLLFYITIGLLIW